MMSSSPFFSELSKLDDSLRTMQSQVERVRAGLEFDEGLLKQSVADARQHVAFLRDLIRAEDPEAKWKDRDALEHLILALEIAADERRKEQRRIRLLELAQALDAGSVKHRVSARASALNALRLAAVEQLKSEGARPEQERELPGPEAREWLHWVCGLQEDADAPVLTQLQTDFPAVLEFAAEMEESFWVPAEAGQAAPAAVVTDPIAAVKPEAPASPEPAAPAVAKAEEPPAPKPVAPVVSKPDAPRVSAASAPVRIKAGQLPPHIRAEFDKALRTGDFSDALSLCYDKPAGDAPAEAENVTSSEKKEAGTPASSAATAASVPAPPPLKFCTQCDRTYPSRYNVCPFDSAPLRELPDSVPEPVSAGSPAVVDGFSPDKATKPAERAAKSPSREELVPAAESPEAEPAAAQEADDNSLDPVPMFAGESSPSFGELTVSKSSVATWVAAGVLLALVAVFVWIHYFHSKAGSSVANAATNPDLAASASDPAKALLHREASEGPQDNILLSMENCERTSPAGIECWGYISSKRDKDSKVSLYRVDVVDGKGNSFDLNNKGKTTFADVHDFTVPAQSKVKYSIKVPDNDKEVRTLTLYLDVNHPRGSEYTFRDVPIAD